MNRSARREPFFLDAGLSRGRRIPHARIANAFGANCAAVSKRIARVEAQLGQDKQLTEGATALRRSKRERGCT